MKPIKSRVHECVSENKSVCVEREIKKWVCICVCLFMYMYVYVHVCMYYTHIEKEDDQDILLK